MTGLSYIELLVTWVPSRLHLSSLCTIKYHSLYLSPSSNYYYSSSFAEIFSFFLSILLYVYPFIIFYHCLGGIRSFKRQRVVLLYRFQLNFCHSVLPGKKMKNGYLPCRLRGLYFLTVLTLMLGVLASKCRVDAHLSYVRRTLLGCSLMSLSL